MSKNRLKLILWAIIGLLLLAGSLLTVRAASQFLAFFQTGADPASALNIVPNKPPDLQVALTWLPDDADTGREMEPYTRTLIESAYLRAWLQWNISYLRGEPYGLETYFVGPALAAVEESIANTHEQGWSLSQTDMAHELRLHFYHADGSVVSFTAENVQVVRFIRDHTGRLISYDETVATYDVVMMLEDGNWRVRHWLRVDGQRVETRPTLRGEPLPAATSVPQASFVSVAGNELRLDGQPYYIRGINYYPSGAPWHDFWTSYSPAQTAEDLALIRSLGLNSVRIFVPYSQFGEHALIPDLVANLDDFLQQAEAADLKVIVTLFDFRTDYQLLLWPNADRHLDALFEHYRDNPTILAWDIKNEPDLDYGGGQQELVQNWLLHIVSRARRLDPNHLVTIGWSSAAGAAPFVDIVDFVSFHYYGWADDFPATYDGLRQAAGDKPIVMSEFGLPTWNSFFFPGGHSQFEQAAYYAEILTAVRATDMAGYQAWTLYDFEAVPGDVAGMLPWQTGPQAQMGVVRVTGELKPAAQLLAADADLAIEPPAAWTRFLKPFWFTVTVVTILAVTILGRVVVWWQRRSRPKPAGLAGRPATLVPLVRRARARGVATSYREMLADMAEVDLTELLSPEEQRQLLSDQEVGRSRSFKELLGYLAGVSDIEAAAAAAPPPAGAADRGRTPTFRRLLEQLAGESLDDDERAPADEEE
ncbi:MAG: cellulase family glycosylhydrolase [Anaerolineales bacterium]|nr:cellulase family glycosylhydrolase [Anaerolineales bacterium]